MGRTPHGKKDIFILKPMIPVCTNLTFYLYFFKQVCINELFLRYAKPAPDVVQRRSLWCQSMQEGLCIEALTRQAEKLREWPIKVKFEKDKKSHRH